MKSSNLTASNMECLTSTSTICPWKYLFRTEVRLDIIADLRDSIEVELALSKMNDISRSRKVSLICLGVAM